MLINVSNKLYIENPTQEVRDYCKEHLVVQNPDYAKKERMGLWVGNTPRTFTLYERLGDGLALPFGCIWTIKDMQGAAFKSHIGVLRRFNYKADISLYEYQKSAVEAAYARKNGIIVMPCGSGKTQTGLALIAKIGGRALWLTHTQDLLNQSLNRAKTLFGCRDGYGTITGGKVNIGNGITFATVQTMAKLDLPQYKDMWDVIIVDECHKAVGSPTRMMQFYTVLSNLSARYKYGLTATPKRADGLERSMFALLGETIYEVTRETVADTTCPIVVRPVETGYYPNLDNVLLGDGTLNYASLVEDLVDNVDRFKKVKKILDSLTDGSIMVLGSRVEYLKRLCDEYSRRGVCLSGMGQSKAAKAERKQALADLNSGKIDCLFATYKLAKEGLDVPNLRYLVLATPEKDETTVIQSVGRVGRKAAGKERGTVIDLVDSEFGMFAGWYKKRKSYYKKIGAEVNGEVF